MFYQVATAIMELKLDLNITKEDVNATIEARQIRVNELSISISNEYVKCFTKQLIVYNIFIQGTYLFYFSCYESFQLCRRKNFQNKIGELLLFQVHKALPPEVNYGKEVKELFLFLAKVRFIKINIK